MGAKETHDWFRKPGSFDITLEKIGCINRAGIHSVVITTVSGTNIDEIPKIIDAVVNAGANIYAFAHYCPTSEEKDTNIEPLRYRQLLAECDRKFKEYEAAGCKTYFNKKDYLWTLYEYETGTFHIPQNVEEGMIYGGCNYESCHLTILPNGDIYACRRVQNSKFANVFTDLPMYGSARWNNTGIMQNLKNVQNANCWHFVEDALRQQVAKMETFMQQIHSVGRRLFDYDRK